MSTNNKYDQLKQVPVGNLFCQKDTFAREFTTQCIDCTEKPNKNGFYEVMLYDTVLFPEGGGQPCDTGLIDNVQVFLVERKGLSHVHYTKEPIEVGKTVHVQIDWDRRWDHVQQHSGQHLLSAVMEKEPYGLETVSWNLGKKHSYIEIPTGKQKSMTKITPELLSKVEKAVNELILQDLSVITHVQEHNEQNRPETLPDDYTGEGYIRTVEIKDIDRNTCCGTHIKRLGQLQTMKILHTENVRGGNTRVFFLFGQRVLDFLDVSYSITRKLTSVLSGPQETFVENVQKIQQQSREHMKKAKRLLESLAKYTVNDIGEALKENQFAIVYKEEGDMEFLSMIANIVRDRKLIDEGDQKVVILAAGEKKQGGPIIITGSNNELVQKVGKIVTSTLTRVKGGGKGRWQGKAQNWDGMEELENAVASAF
ncbi:hypothetical protein G6F46_003539 [Rhizopus delemar]|uniref:Alanyl-transfer RNA synthetases family profile domain-containing protein n=3 Tax=Rhizopus TaxID=4842 RepID=I1CS86_RHIO9|nr:hypothetical protein RO3G_16027 [Rhizopus delemar RA 99-880]KAG1053132.1 hypothetical protein G6F43_004770 [Rhizopus delemar]KAG1541942.1 hypothetical protein G6F51_007581 [Rhizopus arrhizus]KAG1457249.1 hypothetical protein G6F55_006044 [Rhizopus delemar]KAG1489613.1 hypothetical protein G6F54_011309 [Rhizopus delemar]|eukprot:EIE91316.1 hypothetical protein RO3G_16027 [Rhizopus delemar RA 99-880]